MREFSIEDNLKKELKNIFKKDKVLYDACMKKIDEILCCINVNHYKNLKEPLKQYKRVHIFGPFVMIFKYDENEDKIIF